jgi:hypothetical protein
LDISTEKLEVPPRRPVEELMLYALKNSSRVAPWSVVNSLGLYGRVIVAGVASAVPSGSRENPFSIKRGLPPSVGGTLSSDTVIAVSEVSAPGGMLIVNPLIDDAESLTVIAPPVAAGMTEDTMGLAAKTEIVKIWLACPTVFATAMVTSLSPAALASGVHETKPVVELIVIPGGATDRENEGGETSAERAWT